MIDENGQASDRNDQEFGSEAVVVWVVRGLELDKDEPTCTKGGPDEDDFHARVIERDEGGEEVKVTRHKNHTEQHLTLARDTCTRPRFPYFP